MATKKITDAKKKVAKKATPARTAGAKVAKTAKVAASEVARGPMDLATAQVYTMAGALASTIAMPESIFAAPWRPDLVHQVTTAIAANKRQNRAHTKNRAEVSGGGKKPWKQKGTGQARHSSNRSPIWRHGGITFGPRTERDYSEKINKKMRVQALLSVLSRKALDGEIILVDSLAFTSPKTAEAKKTMLAIAKATATTVATKRANAALIAFASYDANAVKSFRNIGSIQTEEVRNLNPLDVMTYKYLIIESPEAAFKQLINRAK